MEELVGMFLTIFSITFLKIVAIWHTFEENKS